jgi:hypothetical protein
MGTHSGCRLCFTVGEAQVQVMVVGSMQQEWERLVHKVQWEAANTLHSE